MYTIVDEVASNDDDIGTLRIDEIHIASQILTPRSFTQVHVAHGNHGEGLREVTRLVKGYGHHIHLRMLVAVMPLMSIMEQRNKAIQKPWGTVSRSHTATSTSSKARTI